MREKNTDAFRKQGELLGTLMKTSVAWNIEPVISLENLKKKPNLAWINVIKTQEWIRAFRFEKEE